MCVHVGYPGLRSYCWFSSILLHSPTRTLFPSSVSGENTQAIALAKNKIMFWQFVRALTHTAGTWTSIPWLSFLHQRAYAAALAAQLRWEIQEVNIASPTNVSPLFFLVGEGWWVVVGGGGGRGRGEDAVMRITQIVACVPLGTRLQMLNKDRSSKAAGPRTSAGTVSPVWTDESAGLRWRCCLIIHRGIRRARSAGPSSTALQEHLFVLRWAAAAYETPLVNTC